MQTAKLLLMPSLPVAGGWRALPAPGKEENEESLPQKFPKEELRVGIFARLARKRHYNCRRVHIRSDSGIQCRPRNEATRFACGVTYPACRSNSGK